MKKLGFNDDNLLKSQLSTAYSLTKFTCKQKLAFHIYRQNETK